MTRPPTPNPLAGRSLPAPILWGVVVGVLQAASPLGFWWLDPATVYALSLTLIAVVYIGFAVADGRRTVIAVEAGIAVVFVVVAAAGSPDRRGCWWPASPALGFKDLWQHRHQYVANTRWRPPFCLVVDWVVAAILVVQLAVGVDVRHQNRTTHPHESPMSRISSAGQPNTVDADQPDRAASVQG